MPNPIVIDYEDVSYTKEAKSFGKKIPPYMKHYFLNLVPFIYWIHRYNLTWLVSDIIAGVTVGIVAVPQGMGYAKIANLAPVSRLHLLKHILFFIRINSNAFFYIYKHISNSNMVSIHLLLAYVFTVSLVHLKILALVLLL
jgi:MFS superfamily sulfate permease-like transporter